MANNLIRVQDGTRRWFVPDAATQAQDAIFEVDGLAAATAAPNTSGRASQSFDMGAAPREQPLGWEAFAQWATAPVVGEAINIYVRWSDDDPAASDEAVDADDLRSNWTWIGAIVAGVSTANLEFRGSGVIQIRGRYIRFAWLNDSVDALTTDVNENGMFFTPHPDEIE